MFVSLLAVFPLPVAAQTVLNFEGLGNLQPVGTIAGATFSPNWLSINSCTAGGTGNFVNPPSGVGIAFILVGGPGTTGTITFAQPVTAVSTRYVDRTSSLTLTAFDAAGNVVGTAIGPQTSFASTGQCGVSDTWGTLSISSPSAPIASVSLHDAGNFFAIDDFTFVTLGEKAAAQAKMLLGAPYGYGGKGYDFQRKSYANAPEIFGDYKYYVSDCTSGSTTGLRSAPGVDCSGLVMWSYNTASGATAEFWKSNPIIYATANWQYLFNTKDVSEANLQPGDLLFFRYGNEIDSFTKKPKVADHVAMYVGGDDVLEAYTCDPKLPTGNFVIPSHKSTRTTQDPVIPSLSLHPCASSNPPCFVGFRTVSSPMVNLAIIPIPDAPVSLAVTDPDGLTITADTVSFTDREVLREVADALYYNDADAVLSPVLKTGAYSIRVFPKPGTQSTDTYSLVVETTGNTLTLAQNIPVSEIPTLGYGVASTGTTIAAFIPVAIDVKPGELPNSINPGSKGKIPVAVLSSRTFDAVARIDQTSLTFGHTGDESSLAFCNTEDVNGDGLIDLVCHFNTQSTGFVSGDTVGVLKGKTVDGISVRGTDSVRIVPR
jgi:hypothetical protein